MARRRKLRAAVRGAAEGAQDVLGLLLQNRLIAARQQAYRQMVIDSQRISEDAVTKRQLFGKALEDPEQAKRLSRSGLLGGSRDIGGGVGVWGEPDLSGLFRTEAEQEAPVRRKIGEATDLSKLPSTEDVIGLRAAEGPIETLPGLTGLLQQRGAKETALLGELPAVSEEGIDPTTGLKTRTTTGGAARRRQLESGPIATPLERTGTQEGTRELEQFTAGRGSEPYQTLEARGAGLTTGAEEDAKMTPGRIAARVGEAGRTTGATTRATLEQHLDPSVLQRQFNAARDLEYMKAGAQQNAAYGDYVREATVASAEVMPRINQLISLQLKTAFGRAGGGLATVQQMAGGQPDVTELKRLLDSVTRPLAVINGVREANVSQIEQEKVANAIGLSQFNTHEEAVRAARNLRDLATLGPTVARELPATADIGSRITRNQQLAAQRQAVEDKARQAGDEYFLDPVTKSVMPVIR